jgi:hypothetical protein
MPAICATFPALADHLHDAGVQCLSVSCAACVFSVEVYAELWINVIVTPITNRCMAALSAPAVPVLQP